MIIGKLYKTLEVKVLVRYDDPKNDSFSSELVGYLFPKDIFVLLEIIDINNPIRPKISKRALVLTEEGKVCWINLREDEIMILASLKGNKP